jgi:hypothetical protein
LAGTVKILLGRLPRHVDPTPHAGVALTTDERVTAERSQTAEHLFTRNPIVAENRVILERREEVAPVAATPAAQVPTIPQQPVTTRENSVAPEAASSAETAATPVAGVAVSKRRWPPVGVIIISVLGYLAAGGLLIGVSSDISDGHGQELDQVFIFFAVLDVAAGIGLMKFRWWGRILKMLHAVAAIGLLISIVENPVREGGASLAMWVVLVTYFMGVFLYMFNAHVKQIYRMPKSQGS